MSRLDITRSSFVTVGGRFPVRNPVASVGRVERLPRHATA